MATRAFFERSAVAVAPELLGWELRHGEVALVIVETEAYGGSDDAASHAFPGPTRRNASMFGEVGHAYIYRSYGMHLCFNIVTHEPGQAGAVLLRAGQVVAGESVVSARRGGRERDLANGPGRLGQALGLHLDLDGSCLLDGLMTLHPPSRPIAASRIGVGPRVGISKAADLPLRFWLTDSADVSRGRPGPARPKRSKGETV